MWWWPLASSSILLWNFYLLKAISEQSVSANAEALLLATLIKAKSPNTLPSFSIFLISLPSLLSSILTIPESTINA